MRKRDDVKLNMKVFQMFSVVESQKHAQWTGFTSNEAASKEGIAMSVDIKNLCVRIPLVVQWYRICFPMQGTQVLSLVGKLQSHMLQGR